MKKFWSPRIQDAAPYVPGEQPRGGDIIKLNTNENPYPPSKKVLAAIKEAADASLRLYPDPECLVLRQAAAARLGLTPEHIFAGNGSDEVLSFCFQAFFDPAKPILFPDITYSFYPVFASYFGLSYRTVPLDEQFDLPVEALFHSPGGVVIANPNAPTGKAVGLEAIRAILDANRGVVVVVDEAYVDFGTLTAVHLVKQYDNLVVVHTLSKSRSLAGLRVGYAIGDPNLMDALRCVRDSINSYTVDRLALAGAVAAIEDAAGFVESVEKIMSTRKKTTERLRRMGFFVLDSAANFVLLRHDKIPAKALMAGLRERGILVRHFDSPRIRDFLRVTIGTDGEMDRFCGAMAELAAGR